MLKESANELEGRADGEPDEPRAPCGALDEHPRPNRGGEIADEHETVCHTGAQYVPRAEPPMNALFRVGSAVPLLPARRHAPPEAGQEQHCD